MASTARPTPVALPEPDAAGCGSAPASPPSSVLSDCDALPPAFDAICNHGRARNWGNLHTRVYRRLTSPVLKPILKLAMADEVPTNYSMLLMRCANKAFGVPNHNDDWVAPLFLKQLMPAEFKEIEGAATLYARFRRALFELPGLGVPGMIAFLDARTQWFDDRVAAAMDAGAKQVVVLAAGFDSTAYRFPRAGVKFFELDLPHASARKRELIDTALPDAAAHPRPAYIAADLAAVPLADALAGSGFDPALPTFWLVQGLTYYLPPAAFGSMLASIRALSPPGSRLAFDFLRLDALSGAALLQGLEVMALSVASRGEPFLSAVDAAPGAVSDLASMFGFRLAQRLGARGLAARFRPDLAWHEWGPAPVQPCFSFAEFAVDE
ncbi:MAG: S-adenosyl-L-methionine-dependent methyltransferase [Monoraphidium minutum]|nr:MAG: S-adenosyl-L-methionine-dependent methyltransferase [Monoraphidium minutum]